MKEAYNQEKLVFHPEHLSKLKEGKETYPIHVLMSISDLCNQDCSFCGFRISNHDNNQLFNVIQNDKIINNPKRMIPQTKLDEILEDCSSMKVKAIQLTGGGEPSIHPYYKQFCKNIIEKKISLGIVTNGIMMEDLETLSKCSWLRVSIDAGTADTYSKIRNTSEKNYEKVKNNIIELLKKCRNCTVGVGFVITKDNYKEIELACKNFKEWGVDYVRISAFFQNEKKSYYDNIIKKINKSLEKIKKLNNEKFKIFDNFEKRIADLQEVPDYSFCGTMNISTFIGGDQTVYTCCNNAYNEKGIIGSIKNKRFKELWESNEKKLFFKSFDPKKCNNCLANEKNKIIINLLENKNEHINFV